MIHQIRTIIYKPGVYSAIFVCAYLISSLINYLFGVGLSWFLTPDQFGVLGVAQSLLLMGGLIVGSGFAWTSTREMASQGVNDLSRKRVRTSLLVNTVLGVFLGCGLWLSYRVGWLPLGHSYRAIVPLIGLMLAVLSTRAVLNGAGRGIYRFTWVAVNLVLEVMIKAGVGMWLVTTGMGVEGFLTAATIGATVSLIHSLWITKPIKLWQGSGWFDRSVLKSTAPLFLAMLGPAMMLNLDILGLKFLSPPHTADLLAGYYQAAAILARAPVFIAQAFTLVLFSYAAGALKRAAEPDIGERNEYLQKAFRIWFWLLLPASLGMILLPGPILAAIFPQTYAAAASTLQIASAGGALLALVTLFSGVLQAMGETRFSVSAALGASFAQILTLALAIPAWGATGAAWSLVVAGAIALILLTPALSQIAFRPRLFPIRVEHFQDH